MLCDPAKTLSDAPPSIPDYHRNATGAFAGAKVRHLQSHCFFQLPSGCMFQCCVPVSGESITTWLSEDQYMVHPKAFTPVFVWHKTLPVASRISITRHPYAGSLCFRGVEGT